jgi:cytochrome P450 family 142 subfamily A polypeptide 1
MIGACFIYAMPEPDRLPTVAEVAHDLDFLDPSTYDDPWSTYRRLRDEAPLARDRNGLWLASRHADIVRIATDPGLYCSVLGDRPILHAPLSLLTLDPPEHTRQRGFVNRRFTPQRVRAMEAWIRGLARETVERIAARGDVDFVPEFAVHVPFLVIAELLGFDLDGHADLYRWLDTMTAAEGRPLDDPRVALASGAFLEFVARAREIIAERRRDPRDDLVSLLTARYDEGELQGTQVIDHQFKDELAEDELIIFLIVLLTGGAETTQNAITGALYAFSRFPGEREKLRRDPALIERAVEEILRWTAPAIAHSRTVTRDHELCGRTLQKGDKVLLLWQSANRDERVFDEPDVFRVDRDPNPHLSFGAGPHFCLGAALARVELRVVFEELFRRLDDIRVPDGERPERDAQTLFLAYRHLRAVFTPTPAPAPAPA